MKEIIVRFTLADGRTVEIGNAQVSGLRVSYALGGERKSISLNNVPESVADFALRELAGDVILAETGVVKTEFFLDGVSAASVEAEKLDVQYNVNCGPGSLTESLNVAWDSRTAV